MEKKFNITYETSGVKVYKVSLPEGAELPADWESMSLKSQDEWLYDNQINSKMIWCDEHQGRAVSILPTIQIKAVV